MSERKSTMPVKGKRFLINLLANSQAIFIGIKFRLAIRKFVFTHYLIAEVLKENWHLMFNEVDYVYIFVTAVIKHGPKFLGGSTNICLRQWIHAKTFAPILFIAHQNNTLCSAF